MEKQKRIDEVKKQALKVGYITIFATILILGISYAWLTLTLTGTKNNVLTIGTLSLELDDKTSEGITMTSSIPMYDEVGQTQVPYTFTLTNNGTVDSQYEINLEDMELDTGDVRLADENIRYSIVRDGVIIRTNQLSRTGRKIDAGSIKAGETSQYELRMWVKFEAGNEVMGQVFKGRIRVEAYQVGQLPTDDYCFEFDESTGMIKKFRCYEGNSWNYPVVTDVVIPNSINGVNVTVIGANSFTNSKITSVSIPNTLIEIGDNAFVGTRLVNVNIPDGVITIGYKAFNNVNSINFVVIPPSVTRIENDSFWHWVESTNIPKVIIQGKTSLSDFEYYGGANFGGWNIVFEP